MKPEDIRTPSHGEQLAAYRYRPESGSDRATSAQASALIDEFQQTTGRGA